MSSFEGKQFLKRKQNSAKIFFDLGLIIVLNKGALFIIFTLVHFS